MDTKQPNQLSVFLRGIADLIDSQTISQSELQLVGEFYMSYIFAEQVRQDNKKNVSSRKKKGCRHPDESIKNETKEFQKFLFLGWYIYNKILKDETL
jgi:hypothetical protein